MTAVLPAREKRSSTVTPTSALETSPSRWPGSRSRLAAKVSLGEEVILPCETERTGMVTERRRRVAVSGLGSIARQHIAAMVSLGGVDVTAFDPSRELRTAALASGSIVRAHDDFEALLADGPD